MTIAPDVNEKTKLQRIDLRTTAHVKDTLVRAAQLAGVSLSTFLLDAAYEKAKIVLAEQDALKLTASERDRFLALLTAAPKPVAKLSSAMRKYIKQGK